jgi:limonene-1,2-epoxide hydrolase
MKNNEDRSELGSRIDRRELLVGGAAVGVMTLGLTDFGGIRMANAEDIDLKELETANETLVNNFCRDWSLRDVDALAPYLADDLLYQITPGQPLITSLEQFKQQMGPFLKKLESVEWQILRSHAIGQLVMNERIDHFNAPEGGKSPSMHFYIAGHFLVENGKIQEWKDWPLPGKKQIIG